MLQPVRDRSGCLCAGPSDLERAQRSLSSLGVRLEAAEQIVKTRADEIKVAQDAVRLAGTELTQMLLSASGASRANRRARLELAWHFQQQGRFADALPLMQKAVADCQRELGDGHAETVLAVGGLALALYEVKGKESSEAKRHHEAALQGHERLAASDAQSGHESAARIAKVLYLCAHFAKPQEGGAAAPGGGGAAAGSVRFSAAETMGRPRARRKSGFEPEMWEIDWSVGRDAASPAGVAASPSLSASPDVSLNVSPEPVRAPAAPAGG